jgi:glycosyltransferase involved in cell wall biosynthesis
MSLLHVIGHKPDIIHAHLHEGALIGWVLSKLTGAPLVFDFQGSLTSEMTDHNFLAPNSPFCRFLYGLETKLDQAADAVLTSSVHAAQLLIDQFGVPPRQIVPTPDCVNTDTFRADNFSPTEKQQLIESLGLPLDKKIIAYLGVLTSYQGIDKLLEALLRLRAGRDDFHLLLMGYPGVSHYQARVEALGLTEWVTFTDKIPYDDAPRYLALGDVATAPKLSATEGSGKILNYMAMGLPTVSFNVPVSREFLGDGGIYAPDLTSEALAAALNRALDLSPDERGRLGQYLRQRVIRHYAWDRAAAQIEAVYQAVLAGQPLPATAFHGTEVRSGGRRIPENP